MAEKAKIKLHVDMDLLLDAFKHLDDLKKEMEAQVTGFNHVVLDIMQAKFGLQIVIGDLNELRVK